MTHLYVTAKKTCLIPLGVPINSEAKHVVNQCSVDWITAMNRGIAYHEHHNINAYMSALQSLIWTYVNEEDKNAQTTYYDMIVNLTQSIIGYLKITPISETLVSAVNITPMARDMTQYALSFLLLPETKFDPTTKWKLLEIALKRTNKASERQKTKPDFCQTPPLGFIGCLWVIPSIQEALSNESKQIDIINNLDKKIMELSEIVEKIKSLPDLDERNIEFLYHFIDLSGMNNNINRQMLMAFYLFCTNKDTLITPFPLESMGFVKQIETSFPISRFDIRLTHGEGIKDHAIPTELRVKDNNVLISSRSPNFFTGFNLIANGYYKLTPHRLDFAFSDKVGFSEIKFLGGNIINAINRDHISTAGKRYRKGTKWYFETTDIPAMDLSKPIYLELNDTFFVIGQGTELYTIQRNKDNLLVCFKNVQIEICKEDKTPEDFINAWNKEKQEREKKEKEEKEKAEKMKKEQEERLRLEKRETREG